MANRGTRPTPRAGRTDAGTTSVDGRFRRGRAALEVARSWGRPIGRVDRHTFDASVADPLGSGQSPGSGDRGPRRHIGVGAEEDDSPVCQRTDDEDI